MSRKAVRNPTKERARSAVNRAVRQGELLKPDGCSRCGKAPGKGSDGRSLLHAHHHDYNKPLDVEWICYLCHVKESVAEGALASGPDHPRTKYPTSLIEQIRALREGGMTLTSIGDSFGISFSYVSKLARGVNRANG